MLYCPPANRNILRIFTSLKFNNFNAIEVKTKGFYYKFHFPVKDNKKILLKNRKPCHKTRIRFQDGYEICGRRLCNPKWSGFYGVTLRTKKKKKHFLMAQPFELYYCFIVLYLCWDEFTIFCAIMLYFLVHPHA